MDIVQNIRSTQDALSPTRPTNEQQPSKSSAESPHRQPRKAYASPPLSDLEERPQRDQDTTRSHSAEHDSSKTTSASKPKLTHENANKPDKEKEVDAKDVSGPAPEGNVQAGEHLSHSIHSSTLSAISASGFSSLPPLAALATASVTSNSLMPTYTGVSAQRSSGQDSTSSSSKHLPVVIIVLISVGVAFLLLAGFIVMKMRKARRKPTYPTPSRPILQDPFADEKGLRPDEESLFGGKERVSAQPPTNVILPWTQYHPPKPIAVALADPSLVEAPAEKPVVPASTPGQNATPIKAPVPLTPSTTGPTLQQVQTAISRAATRLSTLSMSVYPASPVSSGTHGIGIALGSTSPLTADGTPVLQRKPSAHRLSKSRRRQSVAVTETGNTPMMDAYGGAEVLSPMMATLNQMPAPPPKTILRKSHSVQGRVQGRARVQATGYAPSAAVLRSSTTLNAISRDPRADAYEYEFMLPPLSSSPKSEARRERDTQALASALGLVSPPPPPPSPTPTLYPDDSITLAGDRRRRAAHHRNHSRAASEAAMSPATEASARLGNLMLAEFTSMGSLPSTRALNAGGKAKAAASGSKKPRAEDRPPRVPSPPPLPSLAQMAMAHGNADAYEDYRSPTYSIYGLYEADRKTRMQNDGVL